MLGNRAEAEDLTQEVFVTVFKSIESFRGESSLRTWLLKITRNHAHSRLRYRKSRRYHAHDSLDDAETSDASAHNRTAQPDERLVADELATIARATFLELTAEAREILTLRDLNGLKYSDIAEILDIQPGTVRSRLFRARREWHMAIHGSFADDTVADS